MRLRKFSEIRRNQIVGYPCICKKCLYNASNYDENCYICLLEKKSLCICENGDCGNKIEKGKSDSLIKFVNDNYQVGDHIMLKAVFVNPFLYESEPNNKLIDCEIKNICKEKGLIYLYIYSKYESLTSFSLSDFIKMVMKIRLNRVNNMQNY